MNHVLTIIKYWHSKDLQPFTTILTNSDVVKNLNAAENNKSTTLCLNNVMKTLYSTYILATLSELGKSLCKKFPVCLYCVMTVELPNVMLYVAASKFYDYAFRFR